MIDQTTLSNKQLWENVMVDIELSVSKATFSTWFKDTHIHKVEDGTVYLSVPNEFVRDWLRDKYEKKMLWALRRFAENVRNIEFIFKKDEKTADSSSPQATPNKKLPLSDYYINKKDNLNPRYSFDAFVVGPFNELAHAAAQAIIAQPGIAYNPLFVYGGVGRGKTHLVQAIGNQLRKLSSERKIYYVTSEKYTVDYVNAIQNNKVSLFKEKYRQYDVLIVDDIQFMSGKEKTAEELFHLFNTLHNNNKQIIFSSDKHPSQIPNIEERLKSRFAAGMIVDIAEPDFESRVAILKTKASQHRFLLNDDVIDYLARHTQENIRNLEGILNSVVCQAQLKGKSPTILDVKKFIQNNVQPKKLVSAKEIVKQVAEFYNIDENSIYEKTRRTEVVKPRQIIMYLLREDFHISFPTIGQKLGGRDHTTVIHSCEKIKNDLKTSDTLPRELSQIRTLIS